MEPFERGVGRELYGRDFFSESTKIMHGPVQVPVLPRPVKKLCPPPSHPAVAAGHLSEEGAFDPIVVGAPGHVECSRGSGECEHEVLQISCAGQRRKCSNGRLNLVLKFKV